MAGFGFAPSTVGGFGGGYLSTGIGAALGNAVNGGLRLANGFREYQNANMLDQYQIPAAEAGYDASRLKSANEAIYQGVGTGELLDWAGRRQALTGQPAQQSTDPQTHYASADGGIGQNGMSAIGNAIVLNNPYARTGYGGDYFQSALMNSSDQKNALNYSPGASLNGVSQNQYLRY